MTPRTTGTVPQFRQASTVTGEVGVGSFWAEAMVLVMLFLNGQPEVNSCTG